MKLLIPILLACIPSLALGCGQSFFGNRVIGGVQAAPNAWPWQVSLQVNGGHVCGGSIVAPQWILSAGHCFGNNRNPKSWTVAAGEHDLRRGSGKEQYNSVQSIIYPPGYRGGISPNDMVLMKLDVPLKLNAAVQPVCLPTDGYPDEYQKNCMLTGWGLTKGAQDRTKLQQVGGPIVSKYSCRQVWGYKQIVDNHICFGNGVQGGCQGDSGGPLVCRGNANQWVQVGVVSWGRSTCNVAGYPTVFTRVSKLASWISGVIKGSGSGNLVLG